MFKYYPAPSVNTHTPSKNIYINIIYGATLVEVEVFPLANIKKRQRVIE